MAVGKKLRLERPEPTVISTIMWKCLKNTSNMYQFLSNTNTKALTDFVYTLEIHQRAFHFMVQLFKDIQTAYK